MRSNAVRSRFTRGVDLAFDPNRSRRLRSDPVAAIRRNFMLKIVTLITALGLALSGRLLAIGITIEPSYPGQSTSYAQGVNESAWEGSSSYDHITNQFPLETSAVGTNDTTFASQATTFENTDLQAVFSFSSSQLVNRTDSYYGQTYTGVYFYFTLTEDVNYAISGTFFGELPTNTTVPAGIATASVLLGQDYSPWLYTSSLNSSGPGAFSLDVATAQAGTATGTLAAGTYQFNIGDNLYYGGSGTGSYSFVLTSLRQPEPPPSNGNNVPDAGSTMWLLCLAMSAIGLVRRMVV